MLRGVILDIDGTLVDSNDAHAQAWVDAFGASGHDVPFERLRPLIGMGGSQLMATAVPGLDKSSEEGQAIDQQRKEVFLQQHVPHLQPQPGARALIERIQSEGLKTAIATASEPEMTEAILTAAHLNDLIATRTTSADAERSKPAPDIVQAALDQLSLPPQDVIMIGDTPYDVESSAAAGVAMLAVRCGGWDTAGLQAAFAVYQDPADIVEHFDQSPLLTAQAGMSTEEG